MKKININLSKLFLLVAFVIPLTYFTPNSYAAAYYSLATSSTGGTWYVIGAGFAQHINSHVKDIKVTAEITAGSIEDYNLLRRGKVDLALTTYDIAIDDIKENKYGGNPKDTMRMLLWSNHTSDYHFFTRKGSPIKHICDCKGKKVGVGPHATVGRSGAIMMINTICGYKDDVDYKALSYTYEESQRGIQDNTIDVGTTCAGYPVGSVIELAQTVDVRFFTFTDEELDKVIKVNPSYTKVVIPAKTYPKIDYDIKTLAIATGILCRKDLPEKDVYEIVKALFTDVEDRNQFHPVAKKYTIDATVKMGKTLVKLGFPFHKGVIKYLKEIGAWSPELGEGN